ncbi:S8 family serine peptidase [Candidatus Poriferisodalis sp.]|uniref:S8 family serine peptidase n=1 Tax=Candidatus Poriferisodalis sp. TaxID=3101277 RepID=UPI003B014928
MGARRLAAGVAVVLAVVSVASPVTAAPEAADPPAAPEAPAGGVGIDSDPAGRPSAEEGHVAPVPAEPAGPVPVEGPGLVGGPDLGGQPLGPAPGDGFSVSDLFDDDGVYHWVDGDRVVQIRPVFDGADGVSAGAGSSPALTEANLPREFVDDTGQTLHLSDGVVVVFRSWASAAEISAALARHGITAADAAPIDGFHNGYLITASAVDSLRLAAALPRDPAVESASPNWHSPDIVENVSQAEVNWCKSHASDSLSDELLPCSWHLDADTSYRARSSLADPQVDINIGDAWNKTKGQGVTVAIVDRHWNGGHEDLADNVNTSLDSNWSRWSGEPNAIRIGSILWLITGPIPHGTNVAGIVGARDNLVGGRGVAPRATLTNFDYIDSQSSANFLAAWTRHSDVVGVSNHSYGKSARPGLSRVDSAWVSAVDGALSSGYGGLGTVFVGAAGNAKNLSRMPYSGLATLQERMNHRGQMVVCAVGADGTSSHYSSEGSNLWLCAPSKGTSGLGLVAPQSNNQYTLTFGGTSGSAPQVSGVAALVRSVNPYLTWRDVKLLLADTAFKNDAGDSSWLPGAAKYSNSTENYSFSHKYGFGVVDAQAAVDAAFSWPLLPAEKNTTVSSPSLNSSINTKNNEFTLDVQSPIDFVEHVNFKIDMRADKFRDFDVVLVSPTGRESVITTYAPTCKTSCGLNGSFTFGTARHLGEDPSGTWTLRLVYRGTIDENSTADSLPLLRSWSITVHGHTSEAAVLAPSLTLSAGGDSIETAVPEGGKLQVTATRHNGALTQDLVVPVSVTPISASGPTDAAADYSALPTVTIPAGSTSGIGLIAITDDQDDEGDETFTVGLGTPPDGYQALGVATTVTITNDDVTPPEVSVTAGPPVTEGSDAVFTVSASPPPTAAVTVKVSVAQSGDFGAATGTRTVTVPPSGSVLLELPTVDDTVDEHDGSVTVQVLADIGYTVGSASSASVSVTDDDVPAVSIHTAGLGVTEGDEAVFSVTASPTPAAAVTVKVSVAQSGDFGATIGTRTVSVPTSGSTWFTVPTVDDSADEDDGSVSAQVLAGSGYTVGSSSSASVSVADDDPDLPKVSVTAGPPVTEGADAVFTVTASPTPASALTVQIKVAASGDYGATTGTRTVTVPPSGTASFTVPTADDSADEDDGSVTAQVLAGSGYRVGEPSTASVDVADDDPDLPKVSVTAGPPVTEGADAVFTVSASPTPASALTVQLNVDESGDYGATTGTRTVTVPTGGTASFTVPTADDSADEDDGSVSAQVLAGSGYRVGEPSTASVKVADNDVPAVSITAGPGVTEGGGAVFTVSASPTPASALTVQIKVAESGDFGAATGTRSVTVPTGGSASFTVATVDDRADEADGSITATLVDGAGYDLDTNKSATVNVTDNDSPPPVVTLSSRGGTTEGAYAWFTLWASPGPREYMRVQVKVGQSGDFTTRTGLRTVRIWRRADVHNQVTFIIPTIDDGIDEADGSVSAQVMPDDGYTVGTPSSASVSVFDNDDPIPVVSVTAGPPVSEGTGAVFTVSASPTPASALTVKVKVAESGDYGAATGTRTVTVPTGGSTSFTVATVDDNADEADGSITATLVDGAGYTVGTPPSASVSVTDDDILSTPDTPAVSVSAGPGVTEGGGAVFTVTASPPPASALTVKVKVAESGDYGAATGTRTVTVPTGGSTSFTVATVDDNADEADGSITATLVDGAGYTVGTPPSASVSVTDNDVPELSVTAGPPVTEGGGAVFTVTASPAPAAPLTVKVKVAQSGEFATRTGLKTLTMAPSVHGFRSVSFSVPTVNDDISEADGSVSAQVLAGSGYTLSATASTATVTVADNDIVPVVSITGGSDVTEGGSASFTVTASPPPTSNLSVQVKVTQTGDYGAATGTRTVTVPTGGTATFTVPTTNDNTDEADGSVTVTLIDGADYDLAPTKTATVSVADDDDPIPAVSITGGSDVTEGGSASFTVTASPPPTSNLSVQVKVTQTGDYGAATGTRTVTVPTGGTATFTVPTTNDNTDEADGSVTVTLIDGADYDLGTAKAATVNITDNDDPPPVIPVVSITGGGGVTEGGNASYTLTANPPPTSNLSVQVKVTQTGDYGAATGTRTVTVPTGGTATFTVPTTNDNTDEADGSVTATLIDGADYDLGTTKTATVSVADDDDSPPSYAADPQVVSAVEYLASQAHHGSAHVNRWQRALVAMGVLDSAGVVGGALTLAEARQNDERYSSPVWGQVVAEIEAKAAFDAAQQQPPQPQQPPPVVPTVTVTSASGGTEGDSVSFTVTAVPSPAVDLAVGVSVSASGDFGVSSGTQTVTIAAGQSSKTVTLSTSDDSVDEADGSVTLTLNSGGGYTVGSLSSQTVQVLDDDDAPPVIPVVSITAGGGVTEGGNASYTLTANPPPTSNLPVQVKVTQTGDYGAQTGTRTVTVPVGGTATFTVATANDSTDEPDGSVTATLIDGADYDLGAAKTATVSVADDDDAPPVIPVVSITAGGGVTEGGNASYTLTANPPPTSNLPVQVKVTQTGDYGAQTGTRTVTVPVGGTATFTVATANDSTDEPDGSVTATLIDGADYDLGAAKTATVSVADDDDAPPVIPVVSITAGGGVTEGGNASYTLTANPPPTSNLPVQVKVTQTGDYGAQTGTRTVTVPVGGTATFTVATANDSTDEPDGSVTATLIDGADYDLGAATTATVSVADDDDPPPGVAACVGKPTVSVADATAQRGDNLEFVISLDCRHSADVVVHYSIAHGFTYADGGTVTISSGDTTASVRAPTIGASDVGLYLVWVTEVTNPFGIWAYGTIID